MDATLLSPAKTISLMAWQPVKRIGPVSLIVLLHIGFFYALQSGLLRQAAQVLPQEVFASFITPEPAPKSDVPRPQPALPKKVPVVKKATPPKTPVAPAVQATPSQQAVAAPLPAPATPEPSATAAPAAPQSVAAPAQPKTISAVEYIQAPQPDYPPIAKRMGEEGKVVLRILVNEKGRPERVEVQRSSGSARLDEAARQAALRALFKPHLEDGKAVAVYVLVPINFSIQQS